MSVREAQLLVDIRTVGEVLVVFVFLDEPQVGRAVAEIGGAIPVPVPQAGEQNGEVFMFGGIVVALCLEGFDGPAGRLAALDIKRQMGQPS